MNQFMIDDMEEDIFKLRINNKDLEERIDSLENQMSESIEEKETLKKRLKKIEDMIGM